MGRICITIPDETEASARAESERTGSSLSALFSAAIDHYLRSADQEGDHRMTDPERAALQEQIAALKDDLTWCRGALVDSSRHLSEALAKIPAVPQLSDGKRPSWWDRFMGRS